MAAQRSLNRGCCPSKASSSTSIAEEPTVAVLVPADPPILTAAAANLLLRVLKHAAAGERAYGSLRARRRSR
jgi:hypothetical protein